jgi:hypothetical protein
VCLGKYLTGAKIASAGAGYRVDCPACGRFAISEDAWEDFLDPQSAPGHKLSAVQRANLSHRLRKASADDKPKIDSEFLERFIADDARGATPAEQAENLLQLVGDEVSKTGQRIKSLPNDLYAAIGSPNPTFAGELAIQLVEHGLLFGIPNKTMSAPPGMLNITLSLDGWERYQATKKGRFASSYGFIAMKFGDSVLDPFVQNIVKPAVKNGIGYELVDMRDVPRAGIIDNIMRAQIRDSAFVIVDLTHDNSGAYWEAGYAEGLGKPVIYICERQKFEPQDTHFDTNHCTTVVWSAGLEDEFAQELTATLRRSLNLF